MSLERVLHYVSLDGAGGVEQQFVEFVQTARRLQDVEHAVVACGRQVHPLLRSRLEAADVPLRFEKYVGPLKLPKWPSSLRCGRQRRLIEWHRPDVVLIWNRLRDSLDTLAGAGAEHCVYWERGASWFAEETVAKRRFLAMVPAILCNSHAAKRMLELRWGYAGQLKIVHNALRPSLLPSTAARPRRLPLDRAPILGMVARLEPIKGVALAIHAVAELRGVGMEVRLRIAGDGSEIAGLRRLAADLAVDDAVEFSGLVADMGAFYGGIDLLVHPALREPFGQIVIEAAAYGIPAVVSAVDGLVEVVAQGETGICVKPTIELKRYRELGGGDRGLPPFVYNPERDAIDEPKLVDPGDLAVAVKGLLECSLEYERISANAIAAVGKHFVFEDHVRTVLDAIARYATNGCLEGEALDRLR